MVSVVRLFRSEIPTLKMISCPITPLESGRDHLKFPKQIRLSFLTLNWNLKKWKMDMSTLSRIKWNFWSYYSITTRPNRLWPTSLSSILLTPMMSKCRTWTSKRFSSFWPTSKLTFQSFLTKMKFPCFWGPLIWSKAERPKSTSSISILKGLSSLFFKLDSSCISSFQ